MTNNPEADLVDVLGAWFRAQSLRTFFEVEPFGSDRRFDLVAMDEDRLEIVEAKVGWTAGVRAQAFMATGYADRAWAAIRRKAPGFPDRPVFGHSENRTEASYGLLVVRPDDSVEIAWEPGPARPWTRESTVRQAVTPFHEIQRGGVPGFILGERVLNFFRSRELMVHRCLWIENLHEPRGREVGEILDLCGDLVTMYRNPRATLLKILDRPSFSKELPTGRKGQRYRPNGLDVPPEAQPATAPLAEARARPGTIASG